MPIRAITPDPARTRASIPVSAPASALARFATGAVGASSVLSACFVVFGPVVDLRALQLGAGPNAATVGGSRPAIDGASAPVLQVARRESAQAR